MVVLSHADEVSAGADVGIVIPCYGYAHLLGEAIGSALGQTWPPGQVVVVDDGSPDDTASATARFSDAGVRYVHRDNGGPGAARNTGAGACDTPFIIFLDADDRLDPRYIERTLPVLRSAGTDVGYVYTQCRYFGEEEGTTAFPAWEARRLLRWPFVHASALLRAELVRRFPYDERFRPGVEDWDFYLTLAEAGFGGVLVDEPLLWYRKHGGTSRGDRLDSDPASQRVFRQILRRHWRLGGLRHALRVEGYYAKQDLKRRLAGRRPWSAAGRAADQ